MNRTSLLISACLLGEACRYDGRSKPLPADILTALRRKYRLIPVCPERDGGLPTPRPPCERRGDSVITRDGADCTEAYAAGARIALQTAKDNRCGLALLKERSPSCGAGEIHDGGFAGSLIRGNGVTAELLTEHGIKVYGESRVACLVHRSEKSDPET